MSRNSRTDEPVLSGFSIDTSGATYTVGRIVRLTPPTSNPESETHRQRQPKPKPGRTAVFPLLMEDIRLRVESGIAEYGGPLMTENGRDALRDAYDEALDLCFYLRQAIEERDTAVSPSNQQPASAYNDASFSSPHLLSDAFERVTLPSPEELDDDGDTVHCWFGLSYAQYLTIPRSVLQSMPGEWQKRFVQSLEELDETIDWRPAEGLQYHVTLHKPIVDPDDGDVDWGQVLSDPLADYERGRELADSAEGLATAVLHLLAQPDERDRLGQAARQFARQYDWNEER